MTTRLSWKSRSTAVLLASALGLFGALAACAPDPTESPVDAPGGMEPEPTDPKPGMCDPAEWRTERLPDDGIANTTVDGIYGLAADDVWAVTSLGDVLHRDATGWTLQPKLPAGALRVVWALDRQNIWVAGRFGFIGHRDGARWNVERRADDPANQILELFDVHAVSRDEVWAVGATALDQAVLLRRDNVGGVWVPANLPAGATGPLHAVWAVGPGHIWIAGDDGLFELDGGVWTKRTASGGFQDVVVLSGGEVWALRTIAINDDALCHAVAGAGGCVAFPGRSLPIGVDLVPVAGSVLALANGFSVPGSAAALRGTEWTASTAVDGLAYSIWGAGDHVWIGQQEKILHRGCD